MFVSKVFFCLLVAGYEVVRNQRTHNFKEPPLSNSDQQSTASTEQTSQIEKTSTERIDTCPMCKRLNDCTSGSCLKCDDGKWPALCTANKEQTRQDRATANSHGGGEAVGSHVSEKPQLPPPPALDAGVDAEVRCAEKDAQVRALEAQLKKAGDKLDEQKKLQKEAEYQYSIAVDRTECTRGARVKATRAVLMTGGGGMVSEFRAR